MTICANSEWCRSRLTIEIRDATHARQTIENLSAAGVDAIKIVYDGSRGRKLDIGLIQVLAAEAHARDLPVIGHVTSVADAIEAVSAGVDVLAHLPSGGTFNSDAINQLRQQGTIIMTTAGVYAPLVTPEGRRTTVFGLPYGQGFEQLHAAGLANARTLARQKIPLAFGTGTAMFEPGQSLLEENKALRKIPLEPALWLDAFTIEGARAIRKSGQLGSIETGKLADLVLVDMRASQIPPESKNIVLVMQNGQIVLDRLRFFQSP